MDFGKPLRKRKPQIKYETFYCSEAFYCSEIQSQRLTTDKLSCFFLPRVYFLLPREFFFCRDLFLFYQENFSFSASILLLPWPISFLSRAFFFYRGNFSFARSFFLLPWHLRATVYIIGAQEEKMLHNKKKMKLNLWIKKLSSSKSATWFA